MNTYGAQDPAFDEPWRKEDPDDAYDRWAQDELDALLKELPAIRKPMNREIPQTSTTKSAVLANS